MMNMCGSTDILLGLTLGNNQRNYMMPEMIFGSTLELRETAKFLLGFSFRVMVWVGEWELLEGNRTKVKITRKRWKLWRTISRVYPVIVWYSQKLLMWSEDMINSVIRTTIYFMIVGVEISTQTVWRNTWAASPDQNPTIWAMKLWFWLALYNTKNPSRR